MRKMLVLILATVMVITTVGCSSSGVAHLNSIPGSDITIPGNIPANSGYYSMNSGILGTYRLTEIRPSYGEAQFYGDSSHTTVTLYADGTGVLHDSSSNIPATWTLNGNILTLTANVTTQSSPMQFTVQGNQLIHERWDGTVIFVKQ